MNVYLYVGKSKKKGTTNVGKPTEFLYIKNKVSCA